ncbi:GtrA-like protein [Candidatus Methanoplasma termitum]|uniref:GtrA-like protein n=1 Tax=Candidatus Methanoplasma termitum TaxID=1577791 RepID=A0A0A7LCX5_9ARCH|nr:GtrA family protein [Candidatus Methanoplasma termitum]AIZ57015.1 GtrA-like protein [Candidatus Methanoplasma termitum]
MGFVANFLEKHEEGILYVIFGGLSVVVSWGTYALFVLAGIDISVSNILSIICSLIFAFATNKWFVFKSRSLKRNILVKEIISFFGFRILTIIFIRTLGFEILIRYFGLNQSIFGVEGAVALVIVTVIETILNYLFSKFIVFRKNKEKENA